MHLFSLRLVLFWETISIKLTLHEPFLFHVTCPLEGCADKTLAWRFSTRSPEIYHSGCCATWLDTQSLVSGQLLRVKKFGNNLSPFDSL